MAVPENIQKVVFPANRLPYSSSDGHYYIRYRVITESQDVFSTWSPKFKVPVIAISDIVGESYNANANIFSDGQNLTLSWDLPTTINLDTFDVYAKWSTKDTEPTLSDWSFIDWEYISTVQSNSVSIPLPSPTKQSIISSVTYTSTTATYTTTQTHNLVAGDIVTISGLAPAGYNGVFTVTAVNAGAKTFTVTNNTNTVLTDSSGFVSIQNRYVRLWVQVPTNPKRPGSLAKLFETDTAFINQVQSVDGGSPEQVIVDGNLL
jgi:hypothetical protein